jgi:hypothetical protein
VSLYVLMIAPWMCTASQHRGTMASSLYPRGGYARS